MDLRAQRTQKCITDAFLDLRKEKEIEKITIAELSAKAMINKTTFYKHYRDIFDLSEQLEDQIIEKAVDEAPHLELFLTDPKKYLFEIYGSFMHYNDTCNILFSGSRKAYMCLKIENTLKKRLKETFQEMFRTREQNLLLSVLVQGLFNSAELYISEDPEFTVNVLANIADCLLTNYRPVYPEV